MDFFHDISDAKLAFRLHTEVLRDHHDTHACGEPLTIGAAGGKGVEQHLPPGQPARCGALGVARWWFHIFF